MEVLRNGKFTLWYDTNKLMKGMNAFPKQTRQQQGILTLGGMIGKDGSLVSLPELDRIDTSVITDAYPYPQLFALNGFVIVCGATEIYEWDGSSLVLKLTVTGGSTWSVFDSHRYVYMSNGTVAVERDPTSQAYSLSTLPAFEAVCNYNGQAVIGAPKE